MSCTKRLTYDYIKNKIEKEGYKLLSKEYKNSSTKLKVECMKGHQYKVTWNNFQRGERCYKCYSKTRGNSQRLTIDYVKQKTREVADGYVCLSEKYTNNSTKLKFKCDKGHKFLMTWGHFQQGQRCAKCAGNIRLTIDHIKRNAEEIGYKLLSKEYINSGEKLKFECDKGHKFMMCWDSFKQKHRCPLCSLEKNGGVFKIGEDHPNWKNGASWEPYCEVWTDKEYKEDIKIRDGHKCLNPNCWKTSYHLPLCIMHIDNDKKNCHPSNLITGCYSCNARAQKDRAWWTSWYRAIMYRRYGYSY